MTIQSGLMAATVELPNQTLVTLRGDRCTLTTSSAGEPLFEGLINDLPQWAIDYLIANRFIKCNTH
jgi:hypothetical protein